MNVKLRRRIISATVTIGACWWVSLIDFRFWLSIILSIDWLFGWFEVEIAQWLTLQNSNRAGYWKVKCSCQDVHLDWKWWNSSSSQSFISGGHFSSFVLALIWTALPCPILYPTGIITHRFPAFMNQIRCPEGLFFLLHFLFFFLFFFINIFNPISISNIVDLVDEYRLKYAGNLPGSPAKNFLTNWNELIFNSSSSFEHFYSYRYIIHRVVSIDLEVIVLCLLLNNAASSFFFFFLIVEDGIIIYELIFCWRQSYNELTLSVLSVIWASLIKTEWPVMLGNSLGIQHVIEGYKHCYIRDNTHARCILSELCGLFTIHLNEFPIKKTE